MNKKWKFFLASLMLGIVIGILADDIFTKAVQKILDDISVGNTAISSIADDKYEDRLDDIVLRFEKGEAKDINISLMTDFAWDYMFLFGSYTSPSFLDEVVGNSWRQNCRTGISIYELRLIVFTANNIVIQCVETYQYFLIPEQAQTNGIPYADAIFLLDESKRLVWVGSD